jgi:hypothetical protein
MAERIEIFLLFLFTFGYFIAVPFKNFNPRTAECETSYLFVPFLPLAAQSSEDGLARLLRQAFDQRGDPETSVSYITKTLVQDHLAKKTVRLTFLPSNMIKLALRC